MENNLNLRNATIDDAKMLFDWRNDIETRKQSINVDEVPWENHILWLEKSLKNPNRKLMIAMIGDEPVGTVRLDIDEDCYAEISWTVAPRARGRGIGTKMVNTAVLYFNRHLKAQIKPGNIASMKLAESAGFEKKMENQDMTEWFYDPK